ncbi:helix-turn-helix domain-containing protein [Flavobacterium lipolyticum]|uniref:Helix-turn-helix domain-containing protein n=1 Tax=Flavobacterium lipolyticum TaxID=2893754 RepID=A0ABS8M2V7_9FLAO|nr:helix-turn-helix transcriptional regulator [Flavobacterium sp. F-126]MCC9019137.1 helix-turn-helix domain-containing protein [Flavobacterium sp. F-126]
MSTTAKPKHIGRNISRIRELKGMKQEALAMAIGVTQQTVSNLEASETVEESKLVEIAKALEVSVEAIKNFSEEAVFNYFNTFNEAVSGSNFGPQSTCTFNPLDKVVELYERLVLAEKELVKAEKEKVEYLEKVLKGK